MIFFYVWYFGDFRIYKINGLHRIIILGLVIIAFASCQSAGQVNEYGLRVVSSPEEYSRLIEKNPDRKLVNLKGLLETSVFDIRYATTNNFTGKIVYKSPEAFLCAPAASSLKEVENYLKDFGVGLKILDAYRPYEATLKFWEIVRNPDYAAAPETGSRHNRGCAVDLTLILLKDKTELEMPTQFDDFSERAGSAYMDLPQAAIENRALLKRAMEKFGFKQLTSEWWHFDYAGYSAYPVLDIPFDKLPAK